jgi:amino acid adenylation domain-containing protein
MNNKSEFSLSSNQKGLWIIWKQDNTNPAYNLRMTYHIKGDISYNIIQKSLNLLFRRNQVLFSKFPQKDGCPYVEIDPHEVKLRFEDFTYLPVSTRKEKILSFLGEDSRTCFDLEKGPLYRLYLIKEDDRSHYFHLTVHHIIFDGYSVKLFSNEFCEIYNGLKGGSIAEPYSQTDSSEIFTDDLLSADDEGQLIKFWKENLKDANAFVKFPYDFNSNEHSSGYGYREHFCINAGITKSLRELSANAGSSLYKTIVAAVGVLINKYTGEDDFCFGIPVSKRHNNPRLQRSMGYYVETAIARMHINNNSGFNELILSTRDVLISAIKNSSLPFEKIVEIVNPERITNVNPLCQIAISSLNGMVTPIHFNGAIAERIFVPEDVAPFDLTFYIWESGNVVEGEIKYNSDKIKNSSVKRMKDNFLLLLELLANSPEKSVSEIPAISEHEARLLGSFNNTEALFPGCLVNQLIEARTDLLPDKIALISGDTGLTYKELNKEANQVAGYIRSLGAVSNDVVAVCLERSAEMVVAVLGILKAGCTYLPIDVSYPAERINYMVGDASAVVIFTQSSLHDKFEELTICRVIYTDSAWNDINNCPGENLTPEITADSLAYIIYTSGSTGKPKGVKVHHKAVVNMINSMSKRPGITEKDVLLAVVTPAFDMSVFEIFASLSNGSTLVVAGDSDITDGKALSGLIDKFEVTIMQATPALWSILLAGEWKGKPDIRALCGGEVLTKNLIQHILPRVAELWNCYGPTETTVYAACCRITDPESPVVIGKPLDNTRIYIIDKNNNQLPCGVIGEVAIAGVCVTKGYNNLPGLTKEKFIQLSEEEIIYKTGDLGRYLDDGSIQLFGRIDSQLKLRGFRIEPAEIETLLTRINGIKNSVVKIHKFNDNDERLVAFLNVDEDFGLSKDDIIAHLTKSLPSYMIPSFFQRCHRFPRLPNGKTDKKALIFNEDDIIKKAHCSNEMLTPTEEAICQIWKEILKTENISVTDNFFYLGGNSLLAISAYSEIEKRFQHAFGLRTFFDSPRIKDIAYAIDISALKSVEIKTTEEIYSGSHIINGEI